MTRPQPSYSAAEPPAKSDTTLILVIVIILGVMALIAGIFLFGFFVPRF